MNANFLAKLRPRLRVLPVLAICVVCLGASSQSCKLGRNLKDKNNFSDFSLELQLQNDSDNQVQTTFDQQDRIHFVLRVTNTGTKKETLELPANQEANFAVTTDERNARVVWVASQSNSTTGTNIDVDFDAGQTREFTFDAILLDATTGDVLEKGDYQAVGALMFDFPNFATDPLAENDLAADPVPFTLD